MTLKKREKILAIAIAVLLVVSVLYWMLAFGRRLPGLASRKNRLPGFAKHQSKR